MKLIEERRKELLAATREAAAAFIEDMPHIRDVLNRLDPDRGEVRRLSGVLRRLLIDKGGDLRDISAPRTGRLTFSTPDNKPVYKADKKQPYAFFGSAGVAVFGVIMRAAAIEATAKPQPLEDFHFDRCIPLPMDNFLSQHVLCLQGQWITRRDAIKYMANVASGVHSGAPRDDIENTIARIRRSASYSLKVGPTGRQAAGISFNIDALYPNEPPFLYEPNAIDPVLVEVLATAHFLVKSPDVEQLESLVRAELVQFSAPRAASIIE
jgi:hypothetical protein